MWDWLLAPIDDARLHTLTDMQAWHARLMFLGWGIVAPLCIGIARFFKVTPNQQWPEQLDSQIWWRCHWIGQTVVVVASLVALSLVAQLFNADLRLHRVLGYTVVLLAVVQVVVGLLRGSKGSPSATSGEAAPSGDHYCMTPRRIFFENIHKSVGYAVQFLAWITILVGLWDVNAERWMWLGIVGWWVMLLCIYTVLQRRRYAIDTYQAIWGPDKSHPGNKLDPPGWGMHRRG